jgi:hypothetical protein
MAMNEDDLDDNKTTIESGIITISDDGVVTGLPFGITIDIS